MNPIRWFRRVESPPPLYRRKPTRLSPGWHANNGGWPVGRAPYDLTADEIIDLFTDMREAPE